MIHLLHSLCVYWVHQMVVNMQRSVLIVDDDARLRRVLVDFLQKENWQTHETADGTAFTIRLPKAKS